MPGPQYYRKKPVAIQALKYTDENLPALRAWLAAEIPGHYEFTADGRFLVIETLEGDKDCMLGGYWILRGVAGEFYPVRGDIFEATYEPADPDHVMPVRGDDVRPS